MPIPIFWKKFLSFGRRTEILAAGYLHAIGYRVVASSFRTKHGEVDLIAWDGNVLVFIEVKGRRSNDPPEDAVNLIKQQRVVRAAHTYMARNGLNHVPYRFDILAVTSSPRLKPEFRLLRDAFRA
jgi:putative endonuclease